MTSHARKQPKRFKNPYDFVKMQENRKFAPDKDYVLLNSEEVRWQRNMSAYSQSRNFRWKSTCALPSLKSAASNGRRLQKRRRVL